VDAHWRCGPDHRGRVPQGRCRVPGRRRAPGGRERRGRRRLRPGHRAGEAGRRDRPGVQRGPPNNEGDWWGRTKPGAVRPEPLRESAGRKWRLFSVACCRLIEKQRETWEHADLVDLLEKFAEGQVKPEAASEAVTVRFGRSGPMYSGAGDARISADAAVQTALLCQGADGRQSLYPFWVACRLDDVLTGGQRTSPHIAMFLHDIFGPLPFRDVAINPEWRTSDVVALARGIYDEKAFDRMPILADALQDAGCADDEILAHCRAGNWEHVRGCWVLDLVLGRPWRE